jgi:HAD superfamily hydrolase (TIGR01509 family)
MDGMSLRPSVLLFDLGGVLVDFSGVEDLRPLLPVPLDDDALLARLAACPHSLAYGAGLLSTDEFMPLFRRDWEIGIGNAEFRSAWQGWVRGWLPGATALLAELRPRFRLAALSNSNAAHWERLAELGVLAEFDVALGSHELGVRKPDAASFRGALERLAVPAEAVLFFDDSAANAAAALALGMQAAQVDGPAAVRRHLEQASLI